jgi:pectate lyase
MKVCLSSKLKRKIAGLLAFVLIFTTIMQFDVVKTTAAVNAAITFTGSAGYEEGAYAKWAPVTGADGYKAYVSSDGNTYTAIDNELIREYEDYWRVDTVGLKAGSYTIKVEAVTVDADTKAATVIAEGVTGTLTVTSHDRSGFAFSSQSPYGSASGAYNNDGTLRTGAQVVYVTAATAKTCTATVNGTTVTGFQAILDAKQKKDTSSDIIDFRIIGCVTRDDLDSYSSSAEGLQIKGKAAYTEMNITIEGIGEDAAIKDFGMLIRNCKNVELRNFAVLNCMDDCISVDTDNCNLWIHNLDLYYGQAGSDADQKKGDGSIDIKLSQYITVSYNHFWDSGKSCLIDASTDSSDSDADYLTYHHNWFDHSDSRHPRVRHGSNFHIYNNYYDGNSKYGVGVTTGSSVFVEANYFRNCNYPMLSSLQGTDLSLGKNNIFGNENGGMIKAYNNMIEGAKSLIYANSDAGTAAADSTSFDAYLAASRDEIVPDSYVTVKGGTKYSNFDTASTMYSYTADEPEVAKEKVIAHAGRLNGGDLKWTFDSSEDTNYAVISELKAAVVGYTSSVKSIGGINGTTASTDSTTGNNGDNGETESETESESAGSTQTASGTQIHNFTTSGMTSTFYTISGNLSTNKGTVSYNNLTLTQCLKMESSTSIKFKTTTSGTLTLVFNTDTTTNAALVDSESVTATAGVATVVSLAAGSHEIKKDGSKNLYYISFVPDGTATDPTESQAQDPETYTVSVTNGTASPATAASGTTVTITAKDITGKQFTSWNVKSGTVTLASSTSKTTTFTMPASKVEIEAVYETVSSGTQEQESSEAQTDPSESEYKDFDINIGRDIPVSATTTYTDSFTVNGFTFLASTAKNGSVTIDKSGTNEYTERFKTGGSGTAAARSIKFTTEAPATVTVVMVSSNSSDSRNVAFSTLQEDGTLKDLDTTIKVGTKAASYTYNLDEAGTYYLRSIEGSTANTTVSGGLNIYAIKVSYKTVSQGTQRVDDEVREKAPDFKAGDLYVSTKGTASAAGTYEDPMDLVTAIAKIPAGNTIWMFSGTYYAYDKYQAPIIIAEENSGTADAYKTISSINGKTVTINFDGMAEEGANRGITLDGSYWHFYDIDICNAGDNGMLLSGDHNLIELCQFYGNHDTGLQLSRYNTKYSSIDQWPSYNTILNCTAFNNKDEATCENADGFAAKLTCGEGNVFDGCISYCNSDDGWDLFAKEATGPIGVVTIRNCVSFGNGKLTNGEGSANGDMNGFKLGGSGVGTPHIVENCLSFNNGATGFTDNNNPSALSLKNCTAVNNGKYDSTKANFMCYRSTSDATYTNLLSSVAASGASTDQFCGTLNRVLYHYKDLKTNGSYYWVNKWTCTDGAKTKYSGTENAAYKVSDSDFVNVTIPGYNASTGAYTEDYHKIFRNADGSVNVDGLFEVKESSSLYTAGVDGGYIGARFIKTSLGAETETTEESTTESPAEGTTEGTSESPSETASESATESPSETASESAAESTTQSPTESTTETTTASVKEAYKAEVGELSDDILTEELKAAIGCQTVDEVTAYLKTVITETGRTTEKLKDIPQENINVMDVEIMISFDGGKTWEPATKDNFPKDGLDVVLPYPAGAVGRNAEFLIGHLVVMGYNDVAPGTMEYFTPQTTEDGLKIHINSASPFVIGWKEIDTSAAPVPDSNDGDSDETTIEETTAEIVTAENTTVEENTATEAVTEPDEAPAQSSPATGDAKGAAINIFVMLLLAAGMAFLIAVNSRKRAK